MKGSRMQNKSLEFIVGVFFGVLIGITLYACSLGPLGADDYELGSTEWNPMYVKIVED